MSYLTLHPLRMSRVIEQKTNRDGFAKAGELIEIHPTQELTLQDRRIFNLLIENAGPQLAGDGWHEIALLKLRGPRHKGSERVVDSLRRLMTTLVEVPAGEINGLEAVATTVLIAENIRTVNEDDPRSLLRYKFTETLRRIVANSRYWGRVKAYVMFAFSSKYALTLYEALCLRINLQVSEQNFTVEEFRRLLDVPEGKLQGFPQLKQSVLSPAMLEVNALSDFIVEIEPVREGGRLRGQLSGFRMSWRRKSKQEWQAVLDELMRPKVGRKARIRGMVETVAA